MPLPELLGVEVRSVVSSGHRHRPSALSNTQVSKEGPPENGHGCHPRLSFRNKPREFGIWDSRWLQDKTPCILWEPNCFLCIILFPKLWMLFCLPSYFRKSCFVIKSGCQFILCLKMRAPSFPGMKYSEYLLDFFF